MSESEAELGRICPNGHENRPGARHCDTCGTGIVVPSFDAPALGTESSTSTTTEAEPAFTVREPINGRSTKRGILVAVIVLAVLAGGFALALTRSNDESGASSESTQTLNTQIEQAAESCNVEENVGDHGTSITFDTEGEEDLSGDSSTDVACVLAFLDTPDRVVSQMDQTRALDGTIETSWGNYRAFWNYHPDDGLNLTVYVP